jgi:hypothetical protein
MANSFRSADIPCAVARASRPLVRGHPARAVAGAGRSRDSGQDARATDGGQRSQ